MEMLMLLFLLSTLDKGDLNKKLRSALDFYRENRELINMLRGALEHKQSDETPPKEGGEKKESRPSEERADSMKILEEYLKRNAV